MPEGYPITPFVIPMIIIGLFFIMGLLHALFPKFMWKTFESWKSTKEPTKAFFISRRII